MIFSYIALFQGLKLCSCCLALLHSFHMNIMSTKITHSFISRFTQILLPIPFSSQLLKQNFNSSFLYSWLLTKCTCLLSFLYPLEIILRPPIHYSAMENDAILHTRSICIVVLQYMNFYCF